ncbi:hypothetical protein [Nocardia asteroides]|uniref:hypothetical protein n=1 Tax=Nocardia asteroides TaxID=1824 RepID=UPI001E587F89|nr:hypothetical protein [Nocardia asteroides]UGT64163.1 hypothetical protein LTT61_13060 [Nocardia asteroides]
MRELPRSAQRGEHLRTDPDYAPRVETFDNLSHRELHAAVNLLDPAALNAGGRLWRGSGAGLAAAVEAAGAEVRAAMADGWRGPAAANAAAAVAAFEQRGRELADVMGVVGERLNRAGDAAETVRAGVGAPAGGEPDLTAALLDPGSAAANVAAQKAAETARLDVVRVMEDVYAGAFLPTGNGIPAFPEFDAPGGIGAAPPADAAVSARGGSGSEAGAAPIAAPVALATGTTTDDEAAGAAAAADDSATPEDEAASTAVPAGAESGTAAAATQAAGSAPAGTVAASLAGAAMPHIAVPHAATPHFASGTAPVSAGVPGVIPPTVPADDRKKRQEERRTSKPRESSGTEAVTGLGAGAMGGLLGGALAASETTRAGHGISAHLPPRPPAADPDDDLHFPDEELTYLEPGDDNGTLIGSLDPTTPPVLGEWSERE